MPKSTRASTPAMPDGEAAVLVQAQRLQARIDALHDKQDALLSPLATSITQDLALHSWGMDGVFIMSFA